MSIKSRYSYDLLSASVMKYDGVIKLFYSCSPYRKYLLHVQTQTYILHSVHFLVICKRVINVYSVYSLTVPS